MAMGNTRVAPYSWCVDAHAGLDADIISWDMTMMLASNQCGRAATGVELFIRSASVLPKRPAVLLTDAYPHQVRLPLCCSPSSILVSSCSFLSFVCKRRSCPSFRLLDVDLRSLNWGDLPDVLMRRSRSPSRFPLNLRYTTTFFLSVLDSEHVRGFPGSTHDKPPPMCSFALYYGCRTCALMDTCAILKSKTRGEP